MSKPSIDYTVEITDPSGNRYRWGAGARDPRDIPMSLRFSTRPGKGFDSCTMTLSRRLDAEYPDLAIEHEVRIIGSDGKIWWEGFTQSAPRERTMDGDSITVEALGWMDDAAGQEFVALLIDRDLSQWAEPPASEQHRIIMLGGRRIDSGPQGVENGKLLLRMSTTTGGADVLDYVLAWYAAPAPIGRAIATFVDRTGNLSTAWNVTLMTHPDPTFGGSEESITGQSGISSDITLTIDPPNEARYAQVWLRYSGTIDGDSHAVSVAPVMIGRHGLTLRSRDDGGLDGIYASDAIKYLWQKYYPQVDVSGVEQTTYPVPHAVWRDPVTLPNATADLNKYHGWKFGVWEDRKLEFAPHDFTKADWQVRAGEDGVEVQAAGDSTEAVYNGATVSWTDFAGRTHFLSARDTPELRDTSAWIPANQWGKPRYLPVNISWQCEEADAIAIAQVVLQGANRAKRPSVITVPYYIRNGAGDWRPVGEVRSGDTIAVTNLVGDTPRLITATDWADHRLVISTDDAVAYVETLFERVGVQLQAAGVG